MNDSVVARRRPARWDEPFSSDMGDALVARLLRIEPFASMDPAAFPRSAPLEGVLRNDCRVVRVAPGELVVREGDYGASAFLVLDGSLRVALERLGPALVGRPTDRPAGSLSRLVARLWRRSGSAERALPGAGAGAPPAGVFLQDIPAVLGATRTATLGPGELFGELAALTRAPRSASVFAESAAVLLEMRWQGLRDLMRWGPALRDHVERLYRQNSLRVHLRETPLLAGLSPEALERVAAAVEFRSFGSFDWRDQDLREGDRPLARALREPVVVEQGSAVDGVLLVRGGFARLAVSEGAGQRTVAYVGKGHAVGAEELAAAAAKGEPPRWRRSLRAVGYVDLLRIPADAFLADVAPSLPAELVRRWTDPAPDSAAPRSETARRLDFLVDRRLVNGVHAMLIDLDRCTRCDDCVRACAATHGGAPRFVRQGPTLDHLQFAHACMQCVDPVCMIGCPTGAISRDETSGVVRVNDATCVGCTVCAESCPYDNIQMVELVDERGLTVVDLDSGRPLLRATKCDLCVGVSTGPACVHACPHDALARIDLSTPDLPAPLRLA